MDIHLAHHPASHRDLSEDYERITTFHCAQFAYLAARLDAMKEGERSVLDNSCLMYAAAGDENRKLCSLYLSLLDRLGMELPRFGDADTPLAGL